MRDIDYNGFVPDPDDTGKANELAGSALLCPYTDPAQRIVWIQGYLAAVAIVAAHGQAQLDAILERRAA